MLSHNDAIVNEHWKSEVWRKTSDRDVVLNLPQGIYTCFAILEFQNCATTSVAPPLYPEQQIIYAAADFHGLLSELFPGVLFMFTEQQLQSILAADQLFHHDVAPGQLGEDALQQLRF